MIIELVLPAPSPHTPRVVGIAINICPSRFNECSWHISVMKNISTLGFDVSLVKPKTAALYVSFSLVAPISWNLALGRDLAASVKQLVRKRSYVL